MSDQQRKLRELFMPIAVLEHHLMSEHELDTVDLADRLGQIWRDIQEEVRANAFTFESGCILSLNARIAKAFNSGPGIFREMDSWPGFVEACGDIEDDPAHVCSWIFSALYWRHLTGFKLATAWLFINAIRMQHGLPPYSLALAKLGPFLESLSGSGPPIHDGQTFYLEDYSADYGEVG